jgi:hypothetical protein
VPPGQVSQSDASRQQSLESSLGAGRRLGSRRQCIRNLKPQEKLAIAPQIERVPLLQARRVDPVFLISPVQAPCRGPLAVVVAAFYVCSQPQPRAISISFGSDSHAAICTIIATCKERLLSSSCMAEKLEACAWQVAAKARHKASKTRATRAVIPTTRGS